MVVGLVCATQICAHSGALAGARPARILDEARLGVAAHALDFNGGAPSPEGGADISAELAFASPRVLTLLLAPRPIAFVSVNTRGDTSFYGAGLAWRQNFVRDVLFVEGAFGLARHDGVVDLPPVGDPDRERISETRALLGSRWLFRGSLGVGARLSPRWSAQVFYEHLSNGQILNGASDRNQGLDNIGLKFGRRF